VGTGVAENMMSGKVHVKGNASQSAGATAHGGTLVIDGDTSSRCGISMKGIDIIVKGSVGHMSAFMAQSGNMVFVEMLERLLGIAFMKQSYLFEDRLNHLGADCEEKKVNKKRFRTTHIIIKKR
jgi:formylmethanofuran dehydrogenase subunit C